MRRIREACGFNNYIHVAGLTPESIDLQINLHLPTHGMQNSVVVGKVGGNYYRARPPPRDLLPIKRAQKLINEYIVGIPTAIIFNTIKRPTCGHVH